jgi:TATA-binding protein-associated factor Taf7
MKTKRPSEDTPVSPTVESVVEDLSQQDVLPSGSSSDVMAESEALIDPDSTVGSWNDPMGELGHRANRVPLEDEVNPVEELVDKGINEADEELRDLDEEVEIEEEQEEL